MVAERALVVGIGLGSGMSQVTGTEAKGSDRRRKASERLRFAFLEQAVRQVEEVAALLREGPDTDTRESACAALTRLGQTGGALHLPAVRGAADRATRSVRDGSGAEVLGPLSTALREAGVRSRFPAVVILAPREAAEELLERAATVCEPIRVFQSLQALRAEVVLDEVEALVVPVSALKELGPTATQVICSGPAGDLAARRAAVAYGAIAYVPDDFALEGLLYVIRAGVWRALLPPPRVLVVAAPTSLPSGASSLTDPDLEWVFEPDPERLFIALDLWRPDLLVLGGPSDFVVPASLRMLRTHVPGRSQAIAVCSKESERVGWLEAGALHVRSDVDAATFGTEIAARVAQVRRGNIVQDRVTGALARPVVLRSIDRELARARRHRTVLGVALVDLSGIGAAVARFGRAGAEAAVRRLITGLQEGLREHDLVGHLGGDAFIVAMPRCDGLTVVKRLEAWQQRVHHGVAADDPLSCLGFSAGVADSERGVRALLLRADEALQRARAQSRAVVLG